MSKQTINSKTRNYITIENENAKWDITPAPNIDIEKILDSIRKQIEKKMIFPKNEEDPLV